eukprot:gene19680-39122_t
MSRSMPLSACTGVSAVWYTTLARRTCTAKRSLWDWAAEGPGNGAERVMGMQASREPHHNAAKFQGS